MTTKPSWLNALNKTEQPDPNVVKEDEHVEALPAYDLPPPLEEILATPTSPTALPFAFDATHFEQSIATNPVYKLEDVVNPWEAGVPVGEIQSVDLTIGSEHVTIRQAIGRIKREPVTVPFEAVREEPAGPKPWLGVLTPSESVTYDNHIKALLGVNPIQASYLVRLKGFKSNLLGCVITSPELAEEHIQLSLNKGLDPGGWDGSDHARVKQVQDTVARTLEQQSKQEQRARFQQYIIRARDQWKAAIAYRASQTELLNIDVSNKHEAYKVAKAMSFDEYITLFGNEV